MPSVCGGGYVNREPGDPGGLHVGTLVLVVCCSCSAVLRQAVVAWSLLNLSLLLMGLSMTDPNFAGDRHQAGQRADRGDGVLLGFFTWLSAYRAVQNDDRAPRGAAAGSWTTRRCWSGPTWSTPS
jgi:hypothetical protein